MDEQAEVIEELILILQDDPNMSSIEISGRYVSSFNIFQANLRFRSDLRSPQGVPLPPGIKRVWQPLQRATLRSFRVLKVGKLEPKWKLVRRFQSDGDLSQDHTPTQECLPEPLPGGPSGLHHAYFGQIGFLKRSARGKRYPWRWWRWRVFLLRFTRHEHPAGPCCAGSGPTAQPIS